ncbi:MAG: AAA family ATPase [Bacteroidales bacterium]|nr:AAA family ATPase [Bacteroidales bacterium]
MPNSIAHLQQLSLLLKHELEYERQTYLHRLSPDRISGRLHEAGIHYPVELGQSDYNALNHLIITVTYSSDEEPLDNDFEPGRPVHFFRLAADGSEVLQVGGVCFIDSVGDGLVRVRLIDKAMLVSLRTIAESSLVGLQLSIDTTSYQVMQESLSAAMRSSDERFIHLRETLIGALQPTFRHEQPLRFPWLNEVQNSAVQRVVEAREVAVVHGPPGTGKTTTLTEAIIETLRREEQVMVAAPSNAAVDWISEQLMRRGVPVLRIGNPMRMSDEVMQCSYERRFADHPDYIELWSIQRLLRAPEQIKGSGRERQARLRKLRERQTELEYKINRDLFDQSRVISCTLIGSAYRLLDHHHFTTLFIDEAAQALEPACWAAILKAERVVLGGDHQQLPPTVKSPEALRGGLGRTLMSRLVNEKPSCVTLLTMQYRMNSSIMQFPSQWFYDGRLVAAPEVADNLVSPMDTALTWIDTADLDFSERQASRSATRSNVEEARLLVQSLRDYVKMIGMEHIIDDGIDFGIISPYRGQVRLLRRMIRSQRMLNPIRKAISVYTIDGFQGQERDVIIISMVRDNDDHQIGFLRDLRRMNVAITRARMKLIIIGNTVTLAQHPFYRVLIAHIEQEGQIVKPQTEELPS